MLYPAHLREVAAFAIWTLLSSGVQAQTTIAFSASSLEQLSTDGQIQNLTCLQEANPGVDSLFAGSLFNVPLTCCKNLDDSSLTCGGPFCDFQVECPASPGTSTILAVSSITVVTGSVPTAALATDFTTTIFSDSLTQTTVLSTTISAGSISSSATDSVTTTLAGTTMAGSTVVGTTDPGETRQGTTQQGTTDAQTTDQGTTDPGTTQAGTTQAGTTDPGVVIPPVVTVLPPAPPADPTNPGDTPTDPSNPTAVPPATTDPASSTTTTSSSSTSSDIAGPTPFLLSTKTGTTRDTFDSLIKGLPDQGTGQVIAYPNVPWQSYVTVNLTDADLANLKANPDVQFVGPVTEEDGQFHVARERSADVPLQKRMGNCFSCSDADPDAPVADNVNTRPGSDYHLGMLSEQRGVKDGPAWNEYVFDPQLGAGVTIYILDSGFRITHEDFAANGRTITPHVVPNALTLGTLADIANRPELWAAEDINDNDESIVSGHGTKVASVAGGVIRGVASRANLVLVKFRNAARNPNNVGGQFRNRGVTDPALDDAWQFVLNDVADQRNNGNTGKFIVSLSYGWDIGGMKEMINARAFPALIAQDIVPFVCATQSGGFATRFFLDEKTPQNLGNTVADMVTVGGVTNLGQLWPPSTPDRGQGGSISVYGPALQIEVADPTQDTGTTRDDGTSLATPGIVCITGSGQWPLRYANVLQAGLAAYFFSLPSLDNRWTAGAVANTMKQYLTSNAQIRASNPIPDGITDYTPPAPDTIIVGYNLAPDGLCASNPLARRSTPERRQDTGVDVPFWSDGNLIGTCPITVSTGTAYPSPTTPAADPPVVSNTDGLTLSIPTTPMLLSTPCGGEVITDFGLSTCVTLQSAVTVPLATKRDASPFETIESMAAPTATAKGTLQTHTAHKPETTLFTVRS